MATRGAGNTVRRNDPCPCGSGKKYKRCCQSKAEVTLEGFGHEKRNKTIQSAADLHRSGNLEAAQRHYQEVLTHRPLDVDALLGLGQLYGQRGEMSKGVELLRRAVSVAPSELNPRLHLALQLRVSGDKRGALEEANKILATDKKHLAAHRVAANCYEALNRLEEAEEVLEGLLDLEPTDVEGRVLRARVLRRRGRLPEAREALQDLLAGALLPERRASASYELGMVLDRLGEYDDAYEAFALGARERAGTQAYRNVRRAVWSAETEALRSLPEELLRPRFDIRSPGPRPVFLVGFPRSGTTLLEQVLAAHPQVVTSGERGILYDLRERYDEQQPPSSGLAEGLARLDQETAERLRSEYEQGFQQHTPEWEHLPVHLDKLPLNLLELPWIAALFPDARVLVALRDPRDVCLSNFMQDFSPNRAMVETLQLEGVTRFYEQVMSFWLGVREKFGLPWIEVRYEDTVEDLERQARRVLEFLDLPWHDEVLLFHERAAKRLIATPSYAAVTEPVHRGALQRWRHYERQLAPFSPRLQTFVQAFGYE